MAKQVKFNRKDRDYAYYLNGQLVGFAPTYIQAEQRLNELVYTALLRDNTSACDLAPADAADVYSALQAA